MEGGVFIKAWVLDDIGDFNLKEVDKPVAKDKNVIVRIKAAGICGSDIQRVYVNGAHRMPLIIGHEFSGVVEDTGEKVCGQWLGKRVGVFPLIPCRNCNACLNKKYEMCCQYSYLGSRTDGGFAEYVAVPEWNLIEIPDEISFEQAAMLEPMAVAVHAMRRLELLRDASVTVCGLGTIGQFLTMFLLENGIQDIYAIGKSDMQRESVINMGLPEQNYCDYRTESVEQFIKLRTESKGTNVYFDCVGKNETVNLGLKVTAAGGQICMVGNPYSDINIDRSTYWNLLRRQLKVTGTWNSSYLGRDDEDAISDDWNYVIKCLLRGKIHPEKLITHRYSVNELNDGFEIMRNKKEPYVKIMMTG